MTDHQSTETSTPFASALAGLTMRGIGPAFMGGRIADIAIHPSKPSTWYLAVGSGGVWKTTNAGTTWTPVFDDQKSFSIGCVTIDPNQDRLTANHWVEDADTGNRVTACVNNRHRQHGGA